MDDIQDVTAGGDGAATSEPANAKTTELPEVSAARRAYVKEIIEDIKASAEKHKPAFDRMRDSMKLAANGTTDNARAKALDGAYVVPVVNRHINQAVASLYAKNPKAIAKRKDKLYYKIWDGDPATLANAVATAQAAAQVPAQIDPVTGEPMADPTVVNAAAIMQEVEAAKQEMVLYDRMARTMGLCYAYYLDEQDAGYKEQFKALVRRAKVCGVAWVKLGYQRILERRPDIDAQIEDATSQISAIQAGLDAAQSGDIDADSAKAEELRLLIADLESKAEVVVREGPVFSFPRSTEIIPDRRCRHLKTLSGCRRVAQQFDMTPDEIKETYNVDVASSYTTYVDGKAGGAGDAKCKTARVWEVQDKRNGQVYTVCDGYPDFLKEPAEPDVKIERFWTLFPLVLNEVESEEEIFPPSDAWNARHMQNEVNTNRQGLKEHRVAARPRPVSAAGRLEGEDKKNFATKEAFELIEVSSMSTGEKIDDLVQWMKTPGVDPNLYETDSGIRLLQLTVGSQEANLGGTSGDTATETSIAEQSRATSNGSDIDDLDNLLTALARATGQLMLQELSKDTVIEIAGPGAVWPDTPPTREQIAKDLVLGIEAGSSGRPNKAAELANFERAMPYLSLIPGIKPEPLAKKGLALLDIDTEDTIVEGLPSITAMNGMATRNAQAGGGPNAPEGQGGKGGDNAKGPEQRNEPQAQPTYPTSSDNPVPN